MNVKMRMYRGFNRNQLKYLAVFAMLCDHVAAYIFPTFGYQNYPWLVALYYVLRVFGRCTAPIMSFCLVQGFLYTRNRRNYLIRLGVLAVVSQAPYAYLKYGTILVLDFNFIFTLLIGFAILTCYEQVANPLVRWLGVLILTLASNWCDWGIWAIMWIIAFYFFRQYRQYTVYAFIAISVLRVVSLVVRSALSGGIFYLQLFQLGTLLFVPLYYSYNGIGGSRKPFHKWFFYVFYPLHLLALYLLIAFVL
jgi:hypothetical protein